MNLQGAEEAAHFIGKWRSRWPEWTVAEVFLPRAERETALAWAALQQELLDAAWGGEDARPGLAKLAWWQDELRGWSRGMRRHPLGVSLRRDDVPWAALAEALDALPATRERPRDVQDGVAQLLPVAERAAAVENTLLGGTSSAALLASNWLAARVLQHGVAAVGLQALTAAQGEAAIAMWSSRLLAQWPVASGVARARRLWAGLARARLAHAGPGRTLSPLRTLVVGWRAARN